MKRSLILVIATAATLLPSWVAAQDQGNTPPTIVVTSWEIRRFEQGFLLPAVAFDPNSELAREGDILLANARITDPDFDITDDSGGDAVFLAQQSFWFPIPGYPSPEGPPIPENNRDFFPTEGEGFGPNSGNALLWTFQVTIPEFNGRNQARLRGLVDYDVEWVVLFVAWNEQDPDGEIRRTFSDCSQPFIWCQPIFAVENPSLAAPNAPPFADAGPQLIVAAGTTVELDAAKTIDGNNVGFDPQSNNVFDKDTITYTWEFISGPERVVPTYPDLQNRPEIAEVTLNALGTYVFRVNADDGVNALPTSDQVVVEVVSVIPDNRPPIARASGPTSSVILGSIASLDGTGSFDPDGDGLTFRWAQTDEIGGAIPTDSVDKFFQPLAGTESPIATWQATKTGTYYFRLLVSDGTFVDGDRISVTVINAPTAGETIVAGTPVNVTADSDSTAGTEANDATTDAGAPTPSASGCGAGALASFGLVTLTLAPLRGRFRTRR